MARFEKQLLASQKFLGGLRGLPQYEDLCEKQLGSVLKALHDGPCLTTSKVADMLGILDAQIWGPERSHRLQAAMAQMETAEDASKPVRRAMQDYTNLPYFMTEELWRCLSDGRVSKDEKLATLTKHAANLGLRCPTEATCAIIMTLVYGARDDGKVMLEREWFDLLVTQKPIIKKRLNQGPASEHLVSLPGSVEQLPPGIRVTAFPNNEVVVPVPPPVLELMQFTRSHPMRSSSRFVAKPGKAATSNRTSEPASPMAKTFSAVLSTMVNCFKDGFGSSVADGTSRSATKSREMLAIEDGPAEEPEQAPVQEQPETQLAPAEAPPAENVAETAQDLQQALRRSSMMKRPAAAEPAGKAAPKKPKAKAAAKSKAKAAAGKGAAAVGNRKQVRKRPAAGGWVIEDRIRPKTGKADRHYRNPEGRAFRTLMEAQAAGFREKP